MGLCCYDCDNASLVRLFSEDAKVSQNDCATTTAYDGHSLSLWMSDSDLSRCPLPLSGWLRLCKVDVLVSFPRTRADTCPTHGARSRVGCGSRTHGHMPAKNKRWRARRSSRPPIYQKGLAFECDCAAYRWMWEGQPPARLDFRWRPALSEPQKREVADRKRKRARTCGVFAGSTSGGARYCRNRTKKLPQSMLAIGPSMQRDSPR